MPGEVVGEGVVLDPSALELDCKRLDHRGHEAVQTEALTLLCG